MDGARLSRRSLMGLVAAAGLSGCSLNQEAQIADDPYLPTMRKDPLFLWKPAADVVRRESYDFSSDHMAGNDQSTIIIEWTFRTSGDSAALLTQAKQAADAAGYSGSIGGTHQLAGFRIGCTIFESTDGTGKVDGKGVVIVLRAPD
jgi:hypothetical protein